jgi:uncharacterized protein (TIGR00375 family)
MRIITDWHLHSRFSRACSKDLTLENNALWCEKKGVNVLGTADFTHPEWFEELQEKLVEAEPGLYRLKSGAHPTVRFMMTTELAQIYRKDGKTRRMHNIVLAPSIESVKKINTWLLSKGFNLASDGRPILGIDSEELYKRLKEIDDRVVIIPAHAWTPWFSVFGSKSGFDSIEECFGEMSEFIYAIETGLSSDPLMNRQLSSLDHIALISNSDAHSPRNFGREANVFELDPAELSYDTFLRVLKERDKSKFLFTIEFYPEEGKYHADGHMDCGFWCLPEETKKLNGRCPKCQRPLTVGVLSRVAELHDRDLIYLPKGAIPFRSIVPLEILIAESVGVASRSSKKVQTVYDEVIQKCGSEFSVLLDVPPEEVAKAVPLTPLLPEAIRRVREGKVKIRPGYDGLYGEVRIFFDDELRGSRAKQQHLFA